MNRRYNRQDIENLEKTYNEDHEVMYTNTEFADRTKKPNYLPLILIPLLLLLGFLCRYLTIQLHQMMHLLL